MSLLTLKPIAILYLVVIVFISPIKQLKAQANPDQKLTLDSAITIALKNATSVKTASNQLELSGADVLKSYGQFLPSLSVSAGYTLYSKSNNLEQVPFTQTLSSGDTLSGISTTLYATESRRANYVISSTLNLFNGLADYATLKQSLNNQSASEYSLQRAKEQIAFDVAQAYLQILLNQELLKIAQENAIASRDQLQRIQEQVNIGSKSLSDLYQQESVLSADEYDLINAENNLRNSKIALLQRLKINPSGSYEFEIPELDTSRINEGVLEKDALLQMAFENRADIKSAEYNFMASDWGTNIAFSNYLPSLDLKFSFSSSGVLVDKQTLDGVEIQPPVLPSLSRQLEDQTNTSVSLNLSWNIFDGFLTNLNYQQAKVNYLNQKLSYEDTKLQVIAEVTQSIGDYKAAEKQLESAKKGLRSANRAYETVQEQYDVGASTFVELSGAKANFVAAKSQHAQAIYNFTFQKKLLDFFVGTLDVNDYLNDKF